MCSETVQNVGQVAMNGPEEANMFSFLIKLDLLDEGASCVIVIMRYNMVWYSLVRTGISMSFIISINLIYWKLFPFCSHLELQFYPFQKKFYTQDVTKLRA